MFPDFQNTCHSTTSQNYKHFFSKLRRLCLVFQGFQNNKIGILLQCLHSCLKTVGDNAAFSKLWDGPCIALLLSQCAIGESKICGFRNF